MRFSSTRPPISISCGRGNLIVNGAPSAAAAVRFAENGGNKRVHAALSSVIQRTLRDDAVLARRITAFRRPALCYTLGLAFETGPGRWKIPFEAFVWEGK